MDFVFTHDDIDKITKSYIPKDITEPTKINDHLYIIFLGRSNCYDIPAKINALKAKINDHKGENNDKMKLYEDKINNLMKEYTDIRNNQEEEFLYYWHVLNGFDYI